MLLKNLIQESMSNRDIIDAINDSELSAYDREYEDYRQLPSKMTDKVWDEEEDDPADGFYAIGQIDLGRFYFAKGAYCSVEDCLYRIKRLVRSNGGSLNMDSNFVIIQGYKEACEFIKKLGLEKYADFRVSSESAPDWIPNL